MTEDAGRPSTVAPQEVKNGSERPESGAQQKIDVRPAARPRPRISETPPPAPPAPHLADYEPIIGKSLLDELRFVAHPLIGKRVKMVNSTAMGGGVAEMLSRLVPLLDELEVKTSWELMTGDNDFFEVTKSFHNALHGEELSLTQQARDIFLLNTERNRQRMSFDDDFVVIHDPQPAGLIASKGSSSAHWVWRCHIDLSHPNAEVWEFLRPMVERYDTAVFSRRRSRAVFRFRRLFSIPASIRCRRRTKILRRATSRRSAITSELIAHGRLLRRSPASTDSKIHWV